MTIVRVKRWEWPRLVLTAASYEFPTEQLSVGAFCSARYHGETSEQLDLSTETLIQFEASYGSLVDQVTEGSLFSQ